jgi:hypothetical protein
MDDILIRVTATNCGPVLAPLHILPTLWFRNTWSWGPREAPPKVPHWARRFFKNPHHCKFPAIFAR